MNDIVRALDKVAQVPGGQKGIQPRVPGLVQNSGAAVADALSQQNREFTQADRTNGAMKEWLSKSNVGSRCMYRKRWFEKIPGGELMLAEDIIKKEHEYMKYLTFENWIGTIADTMSIPGLKVMSKEQMEPIQSDQRIFPHGKVYLSSSPGNYDDNFCAWAPAYSGWGNYYAGSSYCYSYYAKPMALRCVVEFS